MFKVEKFCAGLYTVTTSTGTFEVYGAVMGYGDFGWMVTYPDGTRGDPARTKREAYEYIRSYTEMHPENEDYFRWNEK